MARQTDVTSPRTLRIGIFGAGSIGCYVGGRLLAGGQDVVLIGRKAMQDEVMRHGLHLTDYEGGDWTIPPSRVDLGTDASVLAACDVVLVTVKSGSTEAGAEELAKVLRPGTLVVSLQNGMRNADILRRALPSCTVLAGMVPFNVVGGTQGRFHQGTQGHLEIEAHPALGELSAAFDAAGFPIISQRDMVPVQWAKLLLNLNNAINALANCPLVEQLSKRPFRLCLAMAQREALQVMQQAGIRPAKMTALPPQWIPLILSLPDLPFRLIAGRMLKMDPVARSSMSDDLAAGRMPEVEWINGEIVQLAKAHRLQAPVNATLCRLVLQAHDMAQRPTWRGEDLLAALRETTG